MKVETGATILLIAMLTAGGITLRHFGIVGSAAPLDGFLTYTNEEYAYRIEYPARFSALPQNESEDVTDSVSFTDEETSAVLTVRDFVNAETESLEVLAGAEVAEGDATSGVASTTIEESSASSTVVTSRGAERVQSAKAIPLAEGRVAVAVLSYPHGTISESLRERIFSSFRVFGNPEVESTDGSLDRTNLEPSGRANTDAEASATSSDPATEPEGNAEATPEDAGTESEPEGGEETLIEEEEEPEPLSVEYRAYENAEAGVSILVPHSAQISSSGNSAYIRFIGPENDSGPVLTDGFIMALQCATQTHESLRAFADARQQYASENLGAEVVSGLEARFVSGNDAYRFSYRSVGEVDLTKEYVFAPEGRECVVSYTIRDSGDRGYEDVVFTMLESIVFHENESEEESTQKETSQGEAALQEASHEETAQQTFSEEEKEEGEKKDSKEENDDNDNSDNSDDDSTLKIDVGSVLPLQLVPGSGTR